MAFQIKTSPLDNHTGAILLMLLVSIALMGLMAGIAGSSWQTIVQRAKETDLLWKGGQIRHAIGSYYQTSSSGNAAPLTFPTELNHLLKDPRYLETHRHLRKLYPDPLTGEDWQIIKDKKGRIIGVSSSSDKSPFKQDGFAEKNKNFAMQENYQGWQFIYQPKNKTKSVNDQSTLTKNQRQLSQQ